VENVVADVLESLQNSSYLGPLIRLTDIVHDKPMRFDVSASEYCLVLQNSLDEISVLWTPSCGGNSAS
jgi:hypothetical protein